MPLLQEFCEIFYQLSKSRYFPNIQRIYIPQQSKTNSAVPKFGFIELTDHSTGIIYLSLDHVYENLTINDSHFLLQSKNSIQMLKKLESRQEHPLNRVLIMGIINALSQHILKQNPLFLNYELDVLDLLTLQKTDHVGMVGFFTPLVKKLETLNIPFTVIEKKHSFVQSHANWEVTLDPSKLQHCNKIIITGTTVMNDSFSNILSNCSSNAFIEVIGPTSGFLPDPLFQRGVDVVGGTDVINPSLFKHRIENDQRWGNSRKKYCILNKNYPGYLRL